MQVQFNGNSNSIDPRFNTTESSFNSHFGTTDNNFSTSITSDDQVIHVNFDADSEIAVEFGAIIPINHEIPKTDVYYGSTAYWDSKPTLIAERGIIYIYSDWMKDSQGRWICGFKVGNGVTFLKDLPFNGSVWQEHVNNTIIHVTQQDRDFWNNKVRCYIDPNDREQLVFTTT